MAGSDFGNRRNSLFGCGLAAKASKLTAESVRMKRKRVSLWAILGIGLLLAALGLTLYNIWQSDRAGSAAEETLSTLQSEISAQAAASAPVETTTEPIAGEDLYEECETETAPAEETLLEIDGQLYLGYVTIPSLGVELPVLSEWSYANLKKSPCRYAGTVADGNLILAAHNYRSHFGRISTLNTGDEIDFTDGDGVTHVYEVVQQELIPGRDVEAMEQGSDSWDLTLFTCTWSGRSRVTVRAELVEDASG